MGGVKCKMQKARVVVVVPPFGGSGGGKNLIYKVKTRLKPKEICQKRERDCAIIESGELG
jgi:hypothetical protein